jgi:hypothetical protein
MKTLKQVLVVAALLVTFAALAQSRTQYLHIHVPFPFVFAGHEFPAGTYDVGKDDSGLITVRQKQEAAAALSFPSNEGGRNSGLLFEVRDQKEYLVGLDLTGEQSRSISNK